jgi:redox-sensitive transcriptional activator SoxR
VRVGQVAERAGVNVETIRYYERRGLLPTPERKPSGHRRYDEQTVRFLRAIKEAQAVGFTLAEIAEFLRAARRSASPPDALRIRMAAKIDEIDGRIASLQRMREELARVVGCACASLDHCTCGAGYLARRGQESRAHPTLLHVTNGESAGNTLRHTSLGGAVLPWNDVLHEGPVPAVPRSELLRLRAEFLSECGWGSRTAIRSSLERRDRHYLDALRGGVQVVLWFEHDLFDQLQLIDALSLAAGVGAQPEAIVVGSFPGKPAFRGLGELGPDELETLWPERRATTEDELAVATSAWSAFRAPEPVALAEHVTGLLAARLSDLLAHALNRLLEELPAPGDGLSRTERITLEAIAAGAATPAAAFLAVQEREQAPFLGDAWFYRSLSSLGSGPGRLVEKQEGGPVPPAPPLADSSVFVRARLRLTERGTAVLRGEADRAELVDVDRWVGGTHLTPENLWRWDTAARRLLPPE